MVNGTAGLKEFASPLPTNQTDTGQKYELVIKEKGELEKHGLELRLNNRFGPMRIRFRLKRKHGVSIGTKTIYNLLKIHKLNALSIKLKRKYKRFEMNLWLCQRDYKKLREKNSYWHKVDLHVNNMLPNYRIRIVRLQATILANNSHL